MLAEAVERYHWISHAYCRTTTICWWRPLANLSQGMRQLNGVHTQVFNRRHHRTGHLLQGRYKTLSKQPEACVAHFQRW